MPKPALRHQTSYAVFAKSKETETGWELVWNILAPSAESACRQVATQLLSGDTASLTLAAVPLRSWKPSVFAIRTIQRVVVGERNSHPSVKENTVEIEDETQWDDDGTS